MSALGHVLFLLPFLRDFVRSGCIASFLTKRSVLVGRLLGTAGRQEGNLSCSPLAVTVLVGDTASARATASAGDTA